MKQKIDMCEMINASVNLKLGKTGDYTDNIG